MNMYVYDSTFRDPETDEPLYLGGAKIGERPENEEDMTFLPEVSMAKLKQDNAKTCYKSDIVATVSTWTVLVVPNKRLVSGTSYVFVILSGVTVFVSCLGLAIFIYLSMRRVDKMNAEHMSVCDKADKAAALMKSSAASAQAERDLNDFVVNEVRNPSSAAISALTFVKAKFDKDEPFATPDARIAIQDDLGVMEHSLEFINQILSNMLNIHRAAKEQIQFQ